MTAGLLIAKSIVQGPQIMTPVTARPRIDIKNLYSCLDGTASDRGQIFKSGPSQPKSLAVHSNCLSPKRELNQEVRGAVIPRKKISEHEILLPSRSCAHKGRRRPREKTKRRLN
ncbi:hypothetical protein EVAR_53084_1 [Eumeta japonica]|uniref:Uncharacterized protein n=1 Tax=Eumeta variegata TaxID=151549 RepID=A0A4C1YWT2_EUMVA|nr:hypothetical protein EVAR_53084_1 [Eumeta japonica]